MALDTYKCGKCGKIVQVEFDGVGKLSCCGEEMVLLTPKTEDAALEKHVPYVSRRDGGVHVRIGKETEHPMTPEHYIRYIEIIADGIVMREYLQPGDHPEAFFETEAKEIVATELCNIHGVWTSQ